MAGNGEVTNKEYVLEFSDGLVVSRLVGYQSVSDDLVEAVKLEVGDSRFDHLAEHYLKVAQAAIVERLWPYRNDKYWEDVPWKYHMTAVQIAAYLINKRGAEGETQHSESGTTRSYESAYIPASLLRGITPHVGVPS